MASGACEGRIKGRTHGRTNQRKAEDQNATCQRRAVHTRPNQDVTANPTPSELGQMRSWWSLTKTSAYGPALSGPEPHVRSVPIPLENSLARNFLEH